MATPEALLGYVPRFDVRTLDGQHVRYDEIWQHRNLVLLVADPREREAAERYASGLRSHRPEFDKMETTVVVTTDVVPGFGPTRLVIADRWGEIQHAEAMAGGVSQLSSVDEVLSWIEFVRMQCPECP